MAKKGKEKKKKTARKILCPSDIVLELQGDEDEALEVEEEVQEIEKDVRPATPSHSRTLGDWDTDTDANGASFGASKAQTPVKIAENVTLSPSPLVVNGHLTKSWADMVRGDKEAIKINRSRSHGIKLGLKKVEEDIIPLEDEDIYDISTTWGYGIIGYVGGRFPGIKAITKEMAKWKVKVKLHLHPSGWLVFKLQTLEDREKVLDGGPYDIYGKPLLLKAMPNEFDYGDEEFTKVSIWVQLPDLPIAYWTPSGLSKIGSKIGTPITSDLLTECKEHIAYARILIVVDVLEIHEGKKILPGFVSLGTKNGKILKQKVKYEYIPYYCTNCKMIGHDWDHCGYNEARIGAKTHPAVEKTKEIVKNSPSEQAGTLSEKEGTVPEETLENSGWNTVARKKTPATRAGAGAKVAGQRVTVDGEWTKSIDGPNPKVGQEVGEVGVTNLSSLVIVEQPSKPAENCEGTNLSNIAQGRSEIVERDDNLSDTTARVEPTLKEWLTASKILENTEHSPLELNTPTHEPTPLGLKDLSLGLEKSSEDVGQKVRPTDQIKSGGQSNQAKSSQAQINSLSEMRQHINEEKFETTSRHDETSEARGRSEQVEPAPKYGRSKSVARTSRNKSKGKGSAPFFRIRSYYFGISVGCSIPGNKMRL